MDVNSISAQKAKIAAGQQPAPGAATESPVDAFAALMQAVGSKFNAATGLSDVENQIIRIRPVKEQPVEAKPRDPAPRPRAQRKEDDASKAAEAAPAVKKTDDAKDTSDSDDAAAPATQAASETTAVDESTAVVVAVAIQFEITIELPSGEVQPVAVVDLDTLLAAAEQNPAFGQALQKAFEGALAKLEQDNAADPQGLDQLLAGLGAIATREGQTEAAADDGIDLAGLFRQIINSLQPQQAQAKTANAEAANAEAAATAEAADADAATLELRSPEAVRQSQELAKVLGDEARIEIKVMVQGRAAAQVALDWSPFNHFNGYNAADMRVESLANGQTGVAADAPEAAVATEPRPAAWSAPAATLAAFDPASAPARTQGGVAGIRADGAGVKPVELPAQSNAQSSNQQPGNGFASLMSQTSAAGAAKAKGPDKPAATTPEQVIEQIKVNITRAAKAGLDRVTIQLRPEELGRIDIKLEMAKDGSVKAHIAADNPATLELLKSESRGMERALQDAGLRAGADDLEFSLRGQDSERAGENAERNAARGRGGDRSDEALTAENDNDPNYDYALAARMRGGVDTYV
jgi:flagellar hook-length control protein FliK